LKIKAQVRKKEQLVVLEKMGDSSEKSEEGGKML